MLCSGQNGKGREAFPGDAYNPSAWFGELLPLVLVPAENVTFKCIFEVTEEMLHKETERELCKLL